MVIVYVWDSAWSSYLPGGQSGSPGHAAISINKKYISFFPGDSDGVLSWNGYRLHTQTEDVTHYLENKQKLWSRSIYSNNDGRAGLDERAMLTRWEEIQRSNPDYTTTLQCSGVVNQLLLAGGSQSYVPSTFWNWNTWYLAAVSPSDIKDYVGELYDAIQTARR